MVIPKKSEVREVEVGVEIPPLWVYAATIVGVKLLKLVPWVVGVMLLNLVPWVKVECLVMTLAP